jgi:hypothetical protein
MTFHFTPYIGADQVAGRQKYALEYGPLLMAALGADDSELVARGASSMMDVAARVRPVAGQPLRFSLGDVEFMPYYQVAGESFSCFPMVSAKE